MLEFITTLELKPNTELLELIKDFNYTINKGKIKHLLKTNKKGLYQELLIKDKLTIYRKNEEKIRIEKVFGNNYSLDRIN